MMKHNKYFNAATSSQIKYDLMIHYITISLIFTIIIISLLLLLLYNDSLHKHVFLKSISITDNGDFK